MDMETKIDQILKIVTINQQDIAELKRDVAILKEDVAILKQDVTQLKKDVAQLKKDVAQLKKDVADLRKDLGDLTKDFEGLKQNEVAKLQRDVEKLKAEIKSLNRSVTLIEERHGEQLRALFDAREANEDAHKRIEQSIKNLQSEIQGTLFSHEKRISKIEGNLVPNF